MFFVKYILINFNVITTKIGHICYTLFNLDISDSEKVQKDTLF